MTELRVETEMSSLFFTWMECYWKYTIIMLFPNIIVSFGFDPLSIHMMYMVSVSVLPCTARSDTGFYSFSLFRPCNLFLHHYLGPTGFDRTDENNATCMWMINYTFKIVIRTIADETPVIDLFPRLRAVA